MISKGSYLARHIFSVSMLAAVSLSAWGIPAKPGLRQLRQPDGTVIEAELVGDEHFHYYLSADGIPLVENADGVLAYAGYDMLPTPLKAHDVSRRTAEEMAFVNSIDKAVFKDGINAFHSKSVKKVSPNNVKFPSQGEVKGLVILVEFSDNSFSSPDIRSDVDRMMNEPGYSDFGSTGSARDYFIDQSQGVFRPSFDVYGPVKLPHDIDFYGANVSGRATDKDVPQMIVDACKGASSEINFAKYDFDANGEADLVFVIYAGYNEAQGGGSNTIWPHAWDIKQGGKNLRLNGITIGRYACTSELQGAEGNVPDGIGTFCHEFSHCLGLPDIYDVNYSGFVGMGAWDLMDSGGYNNSSRTPAAFSAYEREFCGWLETGVLEEPRAKVSLRELSGYGEAFKIVSPYNPNEYYILENRQQTGWDAHIPGHGLLITHIDYDAYAWTNNLVNTAQGGHPHLQIVPSHGSLARLEDAAFPGSINNDIFSSFSNPASSLYNGEFLDAPVSNIREAEGVISFDFRTWLDSPVALAAEDISETGCRVCWEKVEGAECYDVEINALENGTLIGKAIDEELKLQPGEAFLSPRYELDRHHTFTVHIRLKGEKTTMNGAMLELVDEKGKAMSGKRVTMRDYDRDEYWVFNSSVGGRLRLSVTADASVSCLEVYNGNVESDLRAGKTPEAPEYTFSKVMTNVSNTSCLIDDLIPGHEYLYSVKAINETYSSVSAPSNKICFATLSGGAGLKASMMDAVSLSGGNGGIYVTLSRDGDIRIVTLSGMAVVEDSISAGSHHIPLSPGFYIVHIGAFSGKCIVK